MVDHSFIILCDYRLVSCKENRGVRNFHIAVLNPEMSRISCNRCGQLVDEKAKYMDYHGMKWHPDCFSCHKCGTSLEPDIEANDFVILERTGALFCRHCSSYCHLCNENIDGSAIVLGSTNEIICESCFCCSKCKKPIRDLKYTKSKKGLFCIDCHRVLLEKRENLLAKQNMLVPERSPSRPNSNNSNTSKEMIVSGSSKSSLEPNNDDVGHKRNISIDDMLKNTLDDDFKFSDDDDDDDTDSLAESISNTLTFTPSIEISSQTVPEHRFVKSPISSPILTATEERQGLALNLPKLNNNNYFNPISTTINLSSNTAANKTQSPPKKLSRSFSLRSKNIFKTFKTRNETTDTHSGWGVGNAPKSSQFQPRSRIKGRSDTFLMTTPKKEQLASPSPSKVAMFRTPPPDNSGRFDNIRPTVGYSATDSRVSMDHHRSISLQTTSYRYETAVEKEIKDAELRLRKLKLDLINLENNKAALLNEIDVLTTSKNNLLKEVESLRNDTKIHSRSKSIWKLFNGSTNGDNSGMKSPNLSSGNSNSDNSSLGVIEYDKFFLLELVYKCMNFVESQTLYLQKEGIYRKSGSTLQIENVEKKLLNGESFNALVNESVKDEDSEFVHVICGVMKRILRLFKEPVINFENYELLIEFVRRNNLLKELPLSGGESLNGQLYEYCMNEITRILMNLPVENYKLLKNLKLHVEKIVQFERYNKMNLHNLSLIFTPTILLDSTGIKEMVDLNERNYIVEFTFEYINFQ
ncbi:hypothetical protein KAFR_0E03750 [Kazachstania africana CBS 2517]|uniref:Rho-GAP domain-containing protein n=1 Tax=Kazachstania africana (strain ATCC 22294 / BCRC 22015 / CBS 2517 / CECT 1963 / NBRC 1671 / NRRL Y-8276) TaxID=1071382 RepID=H2AVX6_KAZAF|nr:hypothetical protein KAFR_0E03750 [Kazachstania africana CBS 2517]CCF58526.1 hypothetical protein KAFR_0E03750 [Kazachstania africana CBS 2517]